jgi:hypothetical protein
MTVVLDSYAVPEQGEFEVYVRRKVNLRVTADAARRTVQGWLLHQVSYMMGAEAPHLVISDSDVFWRVPVILTASPIGRVGIVGTVDVDVETGAVAQAARCKKHLLQAARELAAKLPAYQPRSEMPAGYDPATLPPTERTVPPAGNPLDLLPATTHSVAL